MNQVFLSCTQGEAEVDENAVQAGDLFRRITTTEVTDEKNTRHL